MTDEPIDLDYLRSCKSVGKGTIRRVCDELERLRTELQATEEAWGYVLALLDAAVRAFEAHDTNYEGWAVDCLGEVIAALTGEAS